MGCVSSLPYQEKEEHVGESAGKGATKSSVNIAASGGPPDDTERSGHSGKSHRSTTRARRLSYVKHTDDDSGSNSSSGVAQMNTKTRVRRLSYVTNNAGAKGDGARSGAMGPMDFGPESTFKAPPPAPGEALSPLGVQVACMSRAGREPGFKKTNQDNCFAFEKYIKPTQSLFGTFDGHGPNGHLVSSYVKHHLPLILITHLSSEMEIEEALENGFYEVDKSMVNGTVDCEFSGTTAVVGLLKESRLYMAWVGDSKAVLAKNGPNGDIKAVDLTVEHKPTLPAEKKRIIECNGRVERLVDETGSPIGPYRVWLQYAWIPGLAMSRALGDVLAHQVGVTSEPELSVHDVVPEDRFLIMASDGVWEFIDSQSAVEIVSQYNSVEDGCRQLVDEAYQRWLSEEEGVVDDITAVVVKFVHR